jgi:hypothetical protein
MTFVHDGPFVYMGVMASSLLKAPSPFSIGAFEKIAIEGGLTRVRYCTLAEYGLYVPPIASKVL